MSVVVFAAPYSPPAPPSYQTRFPGLQVTWTGANGDSWDLTNPDSGVVLLIDGVEGLHLPEFADYVQEFAGVDGQDYTGGVARARNVEWPVFVWSDESSDAWRAIEKAWWSSFKPRGSRGTWTITTPDGSSRSLRCRLTSDGGHAYSIDPSRAGWGLYNLSLVADSPWWEGESITRSWAAPEQRLFFGGDLASDPDPDEAGPPFYISSSATFDNAELHNEGDEETWLKLTIGGPVTAGSTITLGSGELGLPTVETGSTLIIDTDRTDPIATLDGQDVSGQVSPWDPRALPPAATTPIGLEINSPGPGATVAVEAPTRYWRAFA